MLTRKLKRERLSVSKSQFGVFMKKIAKTVLLILSILVLAVGLLASRI